MNKLMKPPPLQWIVPLIFGVVVAYLCQMFVGMLVFMPPSLTPSLLVIAAPVTWILARHVHRQRRMGWGCLAVGILLAASFLALVSPGGNPLALSRDAGTAWFFALLIFGVPMFAGALTFITVGVVLLRRAIRTQTYDGPTGAAT